MVMVSFGDIVKRMVSLDTVLRISEGAGVSEELIASSSESEEVKEEISRSLQQTKPSSSEWFLSGLLLVIHGGGDMFLRNVGSLLSTLCYNRKYPTLYNYFRENIRPTLMLRLTIST